MGGRARDAAEGAALRDGRGVVLRGVRPDEILERVLISEGGERSGGDLADRDEPVHPDRQGLADRDGLQPRPCIGRDRSRVEQERARRTGAVVVADPEADDSTRRPDGVDEERDPVAVQAVSTLIGMARAVGVRLFVVVASAADRGPATPAATTVTVGFG